MVFRSVLQKIVCLLCLLPLGAVAQSVLHDPAEYLSGTLPVMYITTEDGVPITSKKEYVTGYYYIDANGIAGYENLGSASSPLLMQIRGRGNITWRAYDKKSYRLKFDKKASPLGLNKSKHFALMAHADDRLGLAKDEAGYELSRMLGMAYTVKQLPLEVVLNGDYIGLYFLSETIRVAKDRVDITEQEDLDENPATVSGGWLFEIDNYEEENQIRFVEQGVGLARITLQSPEMLSDVQRAYATNLLLTVDSVIHQPNKSNNAWEDLIDIESLAKYYVIHEVLDNTESFSGSCYFYKDRGEGEKLYFGPVWDFGSGCGRPPENFLYRETPSYVLNHWIREVCKYPHFQETVRQIWSDLYPRLDHLLDYLSVFGRTYAVAAESDFRRWPQYKSDHIVNRIFTLKGSFITRKSEFLNERWSEGNARMAAVVSTGIDDKYYRIADDLALVGGVNLVDSAFVFATDNRGHWLRVGVAPDDFDDVMSMGTLCGGTLSGILTGRTTCPTLSATTSSHPCATSMIAPPDRLRSFSLDVPFTPELGEVVLLHGIYHEKRLSIRRSLCTLSGYDPVNDSTLLTIEVDPSWLGDNPLYDGWVYTVPAMIKRRATGDDEEYGAAAATGSGPLAEYVACPFNAPGLQTPVREALADGDGMLTVVVDGRSVTASGGRLPVTITDLAGRTYRNGADVPPGVYIVSAGTASRKVVVR